MCCDKYGSKSPGPAGTCRHGKGFTLLEILVSVVLLIFLVGITSSIIHLTQSVWSRSSAQVEQFRTARQALEAISRRVSQATLNPYWLVAQDSGGQPLRFERASELRFITGRATALTSISSEGISAVFFQSPTGFFSDGSGELGAALNTWGYFVEYSGDGNYRPAFLDSEGVPEKFRYRLIEVMDPSESLEVFQHTSGQPDYNGKEWFTEVLSTASNRRVLADNVVAFVVLPRLSVLEDPDGTQLAPEFLYDSTERLSDARLNPRHQMPPVLEIAIVVIDDRSAARVEWGASPPDLGINFSNLFLDASRMESDLQDVREQLEERGLSARILRQTVSIISAKWSTEQKN